MNKKIILFFVAFTLVFAGNASAKSIGLDLNFGVVYTNHQLHDVSNVDQVTQFKTRSIRSMHMGGFNIGIAYDLPKNWALYLDTAFSFNKLFVNDTQLGFGYVFKPGKKFQIFLGGGLGLGGSVFSHSIGSTTHTQSYFNVGGGVRLTTTYLFTEKFGMYLGVSGNFYKPVAGEIKTKIGDKESTRKISENTSYNQSLGANLGFTIKF